MSNTQVDQNEIVSMREQIEIRNKEEAALYPEFKSDEITKALKHEEDGDARLYIKVNRGRFTYDHAARTWYKWQGQYWIEDFKQDHLRGGFDALIRIYEKEYFSQCKIKNEAAKSGDDAGKKQASYWSGFLNKRISALRKVKRRQNVIRLAISGEDSLGITGTEWDQNPMFIACENGVIDLKTGGFRPGKPDDYIKTVAPTEWQGLNVFAPGWSKFLHEIFNGDTELVAFVKRLFGYAISGCVKENTLPILHGAGRNGKSTLLDVLSYCLGSLAGPIPSETVLSQDRHRSANSPSPDVMRMRGLRIAWASETDEGRRMNPGKIKWLTGGDTLCGREPHGRKIVEFRPTHTLFLITNHKPDATPGDYALWKRIALIPFGLHFVDEPTGPNERPRDRNLLENLKKEGPGILAWLVQGCLEWQNYGLCPPPIVKTSTSDYHKEVDIIGQFLEECTIRREYAETPSSVLYKTYEKWCDNNGNKPVSSIKFGKRLKSDFDTVKKSCTYYLGIEVNFDSLQPIPQNTLSPWNQPQPIQN